MTSPDRRPRAGAGRRRKVRARPGHATRAGRRHAMTRFGIIGFGEVGGRFARDLQAADSASRIAAFDIDEATQARAAASGVVAASPSAADAAAEADILFLAVTAGSVLDAAASLAGGLRHGPLVVDVNSVS